MKKIIIILAVIVGIFAGTTLIMYILRFCPPVGPWPAPPWCQADKIAAAPVKPKIGYADDLGCFPESCVGLPKGMKELCENFIAGNISWPADCKEMREAACQNLCQREKAVLAKKESAGRTTAAPFVPKDLSYITDKFEKTNSPLILGVGLHDIWGNICYAKELWQGCENSTNNIESSLARIKNIGGRLILISDFSVLKKDLTIARPNPFSGAHEINQKELNKIIAEAKKDGQQSMLITNLYEGEEGARGKIDYENASDATIEKLFSGWKEIMAANAAKAQQAEVDYLVINARDIQLDYFDYKLPLLNKEYTAVLEKIKQQYRGKICYWGNVWALANKDLTFMKNVDCMIEDWGINNILKNSKEDADSIENAWAAHLSREEFGQLSDKKVFILALIPGYDGSMQKGWIEPGIGYAAGTYARDWKEQALAYEGLFRAVYKNRAKHVDGIISYGYWWTDTIHPDDKMANGLGHSIRGKDAEQVFYKWSTIFNQK